MIPPTDQTEAPPDNTATPGPPGEFLECRLEKNGNESTLTLVHRDASGARDIARCWLDDDGLETLVLHLPSLVPVDAANTAPP